MSTPGTPQPIQGYDAALDSTVRSLLIFPVNSRQEFNRLTRWRLQEKARALEGNFACSTRIRAKFGRCVAGSGIRPVPITKDAAWNALAKTWFDDFASNPLAYSIDASRDLWEDQALVAEELGAGDGEYFAALVQRDGRPLVQPLDPFEIGSPWGGPYRTGSIDPLLFEDGVRTDVFFRPTSYAVRELAPPFFNILPYEWREVPAAQMIHVFRRRRAKQLRGIPPVYSSLNDGNDALDTLSLAKASAKLHEVLAVAKVVNPAKAGSGVGNQIKRALGADGLTSHLEEQFPRGAATVELAEGEDLKLLTSGRPGAATLDGIRFYCTLLCLGCDLPFSVVFSFAGVGGTATRAELEDAQSAFEKMQDRIVWRHSQRIYTYALAWAQESGELPRCRDPYWWASDWHGPAKITVDYGRSAAANIDLMKSGMLSVPRYCEERGWDPDSEMDKQIAWLQRAQEKCAEAGVEFSRFLEATPGAQPVKMKPGDSAPTD